MVVRVQVFLQRYALIVFLCVGSSFAVGGETPARFDGDGLLDITYYEELITKKPKSLIAELTPLLNTAISKTSIEAQLQARYLLSSAYYYLSQRKKIYPIAKEGLRLARLHNLNKYEPRFLAVLAISELSNQDIAAATMYTKESLELARKYAEGTTLHGETLLLAAQVYYESGALRNALKVLVKSNDIFIELNDTRNRSEALASIALIYDELGQPEQAIEFHLKSLALIDTEQNLVETSITYYNIALTYLSINDPEQARHYIQLSMEFAEKAGDEVGTAYAVYQLAHLDEEAGQLERALEMVNQVLPISEENSITSMRILNHLLRARLRAKLDIAGWQSDLAIAEQLVGKTSTLKRRIALTRSKAEIYEKVGKTSLALKNYKEWVALGEEQLKVFQEQSTRRYQATFELKEAEAENELLSTQKKLAETELEAREFRQWLLIILSVSLFLVLSGAVYVLVLQIRTKTKFRQLALVDELTQTRNRRSVSVFAEKAFTVSQETGKNVCFAMVDIDHFKAFNDQYGHDVGDEVLKKVAATLSSELRDSDALGRWGGEEWLIVLNDSRSDNMEAIFLRIQKRLKVMTLNVDNAPAITISMGVTEVNQQDSSVEMVIKRADEALYEAKDKGRNRCEVRSL